MSLPRYPEYKPSGVEWLDDVPEHWNVCAIKHIVSTPITDGPHETPNFPDEGIPFVSAEAVSSGNINFSKIRGFISAADHLRYSEKYRPQRGDVYMVKSGATTGVTAIVETDIEFNIWSPLAVIRCGESVLPRFVLNFMRSKNFQEAIILNWSFGTQQNIGMGVIENLSVTVPPIEEQQIIAVFLYRETGKIDDLIAEQQLLVELLAEKRQAVISHAVTKGLNPNAPLKDSGIEWLGEVPEHWVIGGLTRFIGPVVDYRGRTPTKVDDGIFLVTARNVRDGKIDYGASEEFVEPDSAASLLARGRPEIGDLLFTMEAPLGQVALIDRTDIALAQRIVKFRGTPNVMQNRFLLYWFMSTHCQARLETLATGSTALGIKASKLGMIECLVPSLDEQTEIADHIECENAKFDVLTLEANRAIELLKEHRSALISAAVTGKVDVREAA